MTIDSTNAPAMDALQSEDGNSNPLMVGERSVTSKHLPLRLTFERVPAVMAMSRPLYSLNEVWLCA